MDPHPTRDSREACGTAPEPTARLLSQSPAARPRERKRRGRCPGATYGFPGATYGRAQKYVTATDAAKAAPQTRWQDTAL